MAVAIADLAALLLLPVWPDLTVRHFPVKAQGWLRCATVEVEVSSSGTLAAWLASGRHAGFTFADWLQVSAARQ